MNLENIDPVITKYVERVHQEINFFLTPLHRVL